MKKLIASLGILAMVAAASPAMAQSVVPIYAPISSPIAPSPQAFCPALSYNLYVGLNDYYTRGQVTALQQFFAARGMYQPVTGYFGPITAANTASFQRQYGVYPITGGVGPLTRAAIARLCNGNGGVYPPSAQAPVIYSVTPTSGPVGTVVAIRGANFGASNTVHFGAGGHMQVPSFFGGTTIYYTIPNQVSPCDVVMTFAVCAQYVQLVTPGTYSISVSNQYGQSAAQNFMVTGTSGGPVGGMTVSSPAAGQTYRRGQDMTITWGYPVTPNSTQVMLELYSASGSRIGLIAVSNSTSGSYTWHIPAFPQNYMCTLQYPNGLCGTNIPDGQYYIKVSASNDPFDSNPNIIASAQSGTFTMTGGSAASGVSAAPQSGPVPFTTTFTLGNYTGQYRVDYGDGLSNSLISGSASHTYYNRGTYTATFVSDYPCLHNTPACEIAQQNLGSVTVTAY